MKEGLSTLWQNAAPPTFGQGVNPFAKYAQREGFSDFGGNLSGAPPTSTPTSTSPYMGAGSTGTGPSIGSPQNNPNIGAPLTGRPQGKRLAGAPPGAGKGRGKGGQKAQASALRGGSTGG